MKAMIVITDTRRGGTPTRLAAVARGARDQGWTVAVVSVLPEGEIAGELARDGVATASLGVSSPRRALGGVKRLRRMIVQERPDVVQSALWHANLLARIATRGTGVPLVTGYQSLDVHKSRSRVYLDRIGGRADARVVCVSQAVAESVVRRERLARDRIVVIPTGRPVPRPISDADRRAARQRLGIPDEARVIGWVGRMHAVKRLPLLLSAIAQTSDSWCVLVGDGEERAALGDEVARLGISERVIMTGMVEDPRALVPAFDVFCLTSLWEGSPGALVEAMAAGHPCVVAAFPGVEEIVVDGVDGIVTGSSAGEIAAGIEAALQRPELGPAAREKVSERFSVGAMVDAYLGVWSDAISRRG